MKLRLGYRYHKAIWTILILFPLFNNVLHDIYLGQRFFLVLSFFICVLTLVAQASSVTYRRFASETFGALSGLVVYILFVSLIQIGRFNYEDILDVVRPLFYLVFLFTGMYCSLSENEIASLFQHIYKLVLVQCVFNFFVYVPRLWPIVNLYKGRLSEEIGFYAIDHFFRFSGFLGYPGDYAIFIIPFFIEMVRRLFNDPSFSKFFQVGILACNLLLSQSRAALALFCLVFFVFSIKYKFYRFRGFYVFCGILIACLVVLLWKNPLSIRYVLMLIEDFGSDASMSHRLYELKLTAQSIIDNFPIGYGPAKQYIVEMIGPTESMYGFYGIKFGFLGICAYLFFNIMLFLQLKSTKATNYLLKFGRDYFMVFIILNVCLLSFFTSPLDRYKNMFIYYVAIGYVLSIKRNRPKIYEEATCYV